MKVMFVENRQQTRFWAAIAALLQEDGHEIYWVVQNAGFVPDVGESHVIAYPKGRRKRSSIARDAEYGTIVSSDRNINYFGGDSSHYGHYDTEIRRILDTVKPALVFGEATLFHELLCIKHCRLQDILYLQPASCRYPPGRFSFYLYDTLIPFLGSAEIFGRLDSLAMIDRISKRQVEPDYMIRQTHRRAFDSRLRRVWNGWVIAASYFAGERYNTPSPHSKFVLECQLRRNKLRWEKLAYHAPAVGNRFRILYPLQMQPENNIDLWGNAYRQQTVLLKALLQATNDKIVMVVKPNPKSKYELSDELIDLIASSDRLVPVSHKANMKDVLEAVDLTVTATGTVAIEAIFAGRPVVTLVKTLNNTVPGCIHLEDLTGLGSIVGHVQERTFPIVSEAEKLAFLSLLTRSSYRGIISNPYSTPTCLNGENVSDVSAAFRHVLGSIGKRAEGRQACSDHVSIRIAHFEHA